MRQIRHDQREQESSIDSIALALAGASSVRPDKRKTYQFRDGKLLVSAQVTEASYWVRIGPGLSTMIERDGFHVIVKYDERVVRESVGILKPHFQTEYAEVSQSTAWIARLNEAYKRRTAA